MSTRIKAKEKKGIVEIKAMAKHPMLSYQEAERAKKKANFITYLKAEVNGKIVYEVSTSQFLSKDPYISFKYKGAKGDEIVITWTDLLGKTDVSKATVK